MLFSEYVFLEEAKEASEKELKAKHQFDEKFKTLNRGNMIFNPHSCYQLLDRHKNMNQRRLQYFIDKVHELDFKTAQYYLVFSKSLDFGMILNKNASGKIFVVTVLPKGKKFPKPDTELVLVENKNVQIIIIEENFE